MTMRRRSSLNL
ncbi:hypothetical protein CIB84_016827 [Bambusicola thoracicus]|uniref:Uncharacterized protein n=1 Tax=Bambusicola thoracicus TaxID=9083 RepID=A0A2P4S5U6_BAMTH|nr:hypothetical protein CIB84_016827 [Bambusicola thoracicus]